MLAVTSAEDDSVLHKLIKHEFTEAMSKICLDIYGLWPLQTQTVFMRIRCSLCMIVQFMVLPFLVMDYTMGSDQSIASSKVENILYLTSIFNGIIKCTCISLGRKKLYTNIDAAVDDWLSVKDDEKARKIMKRYAYASRILTSVLLYSIFVCMGIYVLTIIAINVKNIFFTDPNLADADTNVTNWIFLIPSGSLGSLVTGSQYAVILTIQILQTLLIGVTQCVADSFFFNVTIHLAGQLEVLKHKFKIFESEKRSTEANYRKRFVDLINRHNELIDFNQNLEDIFHFVILFQLVMITMTLALTGLRINLCLKENNQIEAMKSLLVMNYLFMQSLVYTYSGDLLQTKSEDIFYALYATSWFTLPLASMRDLYFAMMRSSIPLRLTGGKFFYVNRETTMYIFKTAASYVSVLRIALND